MTAAPTGPEPRTDAAVERPIRQQLAAASARAQSLPSWARPTWTRPFSNGDDA